MPIQVTCPACDRPLRVPDDLIGKDVKCPSCLKQFVATADGTTPTSSAPREEMYRAAGDQPTLPPSESAPPAQGTDTFRAKELQPTLPGRLPRLDDYEDDDDDDIPRRRRAPDRAYARNRVASSAGGLVAVGVIGIIFSALGLLGGLANVGGAGAMPRGKGGAPAFAIGNAAGNTVGSGLSLAMSILVVIGGQKMKNLQGYGLAKAAAIIAIIPCTSPCCILGIPFGIMALNALNDPMVKQAFDVEMPPRDY